MKVFCILLLIGSIFQVHSKPVYTLGVDEVKYICAKATENECLEMVITDEDYVHPTFFNAETETFFYLFTRQNPKEPQEIKYTDRASLDSSNYDELRPTKVVIHGYWNGANAKVNTVLREAYLSRHDVNLIVVDWSAGAKTIMYNWASRRVSEVGAVVAEFLDMAIGHVTWKWNQLTVVGYSLGAHAAGFAGKNVKNGKIGTIIGLDPAGPLFRGIDKSRRLNASDANYVEVIHANWKFYGLSEASGTSDFYANGGYTQPSCPYFTEDLCSHSRSIDLYAESLIDNTFTSNQCKTGTNLKENKGKNLESCCGPKAKFGGEPGNINNLNTNGIYYMPTNGDAHYGLGEFKEMCWS